MDIDELAQRLAAMEESQYAQEQQGIQGQFMDKYGAKFANDGDLGVAILGELNRRGIDVSAADSAVQEILDGIRAEATALLDKIKSQSADVSALMDKVNSIDESVMAASGATGTEAPGGDPMAGLPPELAGLMAGGGELPPPEAAPMEAAPPEVAPMEDAGPPPEAPPPEEPPPPEQGVVSDKRLKNLQGRIATTLSDQRMKAAVPKWTPSKQLLAGANGEYI